MRSLLAHAVICLVMIHATPTPPHDILELNHVYDERAERRFSQIIAWDWRDEGLTCEGWTIAEPDKVAVNPWRDGVEIVKEGKRLRGRSYKETWTQWDREVIDRDNTPCDRRMGLRWEQ